MRGHIYVNVWTKFEILTPYISWDTVHFVEMLSIDPKIASALLWLLYGLYYIWGKTNFEKTYPKEFFDAFMMISVWKVDLTAEIKISENVLSLFGALWLIWGSNFLVFSPGYSQFLSIYYSQYQIADPIISAASLVTFLLVPTLLSMCATLLIK